MGNTRRDFIKAGVALGTGIPAALADTKIERSSAKALDLLILGGTGFIGPHMVHPAVSAVSGPAGPVFRAGRSARLFATCSPGGTRYRMSERRNFVPVWIRSARMI